MLNYAKKQAQDLSKKIARQVAREPLEVLKSARGQLSGEQAKYIEQKINQEKESQTKDPKTQELKNKDTIRASRALEALDRELQDIRRDKLIKELQRKIAEGQEISLEDYPELTPEQKQVLKAQIEAGVDAVQIFDSWGGSLSAAEYAVWSAPYIKEVVAALKPTGIPITLYIKDSGHLLDQMV